MDGGSLIGLGSYGCVFNPSIPCEGSNDTVRDKNRVSKVFVGSGSHNSYKFELAINNRVKAIKGYHKWANIWDKTCKPPSYNKIRSIEKDIKDCLHKGNISVKTFNKNKYVLHGDHAGSTLTENIMKAFTSTSFTNKTKFTTQFLQCMKLMKPLFLGLSAMYENNISHNDIKEDNIMVDKEGYKYIDFGLSCDSSDYKHYKGRSQIEYSWSRIYPPYPYEFIYLYANKGELVEEKEELDVGKYRKDHNLYKTTHEVIFNRKDIHNYVDNTLDVFIEKPLGTVDIRKQITSLLDTYSLGMLFPSILVRLANKYRKIGKLRELVKINKVREFIDLFKHMSAPTYYNRTNPTDAYQSYLHLDKSYLTKSRLKRTHRRRQTTRRKKR